MIKIWQILLVHQLLFQGMFIVKNILTRQKTGQPVRGKNKETMLAIFFFTFFISLALLISLKQDPFGYILLLSQTSAKMIGLLLLLLNLSISVISLIHLKDSWRVGIVKDQTTELVTTGIYRFTRNPYFVSYLLMFAAYTVLLQNLILFIFSFIGFGFIHNMIKKEEDYLVSLHGHTYKEYCQKVARYILW